MTKALRLFAWGGLVAGVALTVMTLAMMQPHNMPARATVWGLAILAGARSLVLGVAWWLVFMTLAHLREEAEENRDRLHRILRDTSRSST